ncbi:GNAT family N-acetyltransferase [Spirosoma sp. HMF3257]|uniref:Aminoglycoside N(6')-acetyltransferase type 1 n=1 Tax=Spirosoma telluris TaxID=2183553 RepID=A0A327NHK3_9BACT|nr:GNAT family N-acetyltransferase [Spirosoma telluris]RAI73414.1 GNAT family N-acetyltransferase [Spirosoma telluris]
MEIQQLSENNLHEFVDLVLELWTDCAFEEEYENYKRILRLDNEICYLLKDQGIYIAFIHLTIRTDYVEGATEFPVAYIEALYVKPTYQKLGLGSKLVSAGENWSRQKGCGQLASDTELTNSIAIDFHKNIGFDEVNRIVCFVKKL